MSAVALGAIVVGAGFAFVLNGMRGPGDMASAPSLTPVATSTSEETPQVSPSPSVTVSAGASASAAASTSPRPAGSASPPTPSPPSSPPATTPEPVEAGNQLAGKWEPLPPAPLTGKFTAGGALRLADGRIAALFSPDFDDGDPCIWLYSPGTETWEAAAAEGEPPWDDCFGSNARYVPGPDGRYYDSASILDTSSDPWQLMSAPWRAEVGGTSIGILPEGQVYTVRSYCSRECRATVFEVDTETGEIAQVAEAPRPGPEGEVIAGPPSSTLFFAGVDDSYDTSSLLSYEPAFDDWTTHPTVPFWGNWNRARLTDDGWLWVKAFQTPTREVYARDPDSGQWLTVPLPPDLRSKWSPVFIDGPDGRIYAIDAHQAFVFTPDR